MTLRIPRKKVESTRKRKRGSYVFYVDISLRVKVIDTPVLLKSTFTYALSYTVHFSCNPTLFNAIICIMLMTSLYYRGYYGNTASFLLKLRAIDIIGVTLSSKVLFCVTALFMS